ncbi:unnamed protein product, partial [Prorocentrum cordatum]
GGGGGGGCAGAPEAVNDFFKGPLRALPELEAALRPKAAPVDLTAQLTQVGSPGVPRPLWLVIAASVPTALLWYGAGYKLLVEEEMYVADVGRPGPDGEPGQAKGFGGPGTLGPFVLGLALGPLAALLGLPGGEAWSAVGFVWIYYTQYLLYARVNELYESEEKEDTPLLAVEVALQVRPPPLAEPPLPAWTAAAGRGGAAGRAAQRRQAAAFAWARAHRRAPGPCARQAVGQAAAAAEGSPPLLPCALFRGVRSWTDERERGQTKRKRPAPALQLILGAPRATAPLGLVRAGGGGPTSWTWRPEGAALSRRPGGTWGRPGGR